MNVILYHGVDRPRQGGVANPNYASTEVDIQYDSLRFKANTRNETNIQDNSQDYEPEYSHLKLVYGLIMATNLNFYIIVWIIIVAL